MKRKSSKFEMTEKAGRVVGKWQVHIVVGVIEIS